MSLKNDVVRYGQPFLTQEGMIAANKQRNCSHEFAGTGSSTNDGHEKISF